MLQIDFGQNIAIYDAHLCSLDCRGKLFQHCPLQNVIAIAAHSWHIVCFYSKWQRCPK
jgi:hypothetical protein